MTERLIAAGGSSQVAAAAAGATAPTPLANESGARPNDSQPNSAVAPPSNGP